jgi:hypothetical protein
MNIALEFMNKGSLQRILSQMGRIPEDIIGHIAY